MVLNWLLKLSRFFVRSSLNYYRNLTLAGGRPTSYDPKYCKMLIEHMSTGRAYQSFAPKLNVALATLYEWEKVHPEFLEAKSIAFEKNYQWWENEGHKGMWGDKEGPTFNTTLWIFQMKNRHRWRDRHDVDLKSTDTQLDKKQELSKLSMQELKELVKNSLKEEK